MSVRQKQPNDTVTKRKYRAEKVKKWGRADKNATRPIGQKDCHYHFPVTELMHHPPSKPFQPTLLGPLPLALNRAEGDLGRDKAPSVRPLRRIPLPRKVGGRRRVLCLARAKYHAKDEKRKSEKRNRHLFIEFERSVWLSSTSKNFPTSAFAIRKQGLVSSH